MSKEKKDIYLNSGGSEGDETNGRSSTKLKTFASFKHPVFRIFYGTMIGQWTNQSISMMTNALLAYRLTSSGVAIGAVFISQSVSQIIMAFIGGTIADRVQKKYILLFNQIGLALLSLSFGVILSMGYVTSESWWPLLIMVIFQGALLGFMSPTTYSIIPEIVSDKQVMNAVSLTAMGQTIFRLVAPSLAGFLIDTYDFASIFYLMTGMYIMGSIFAIFLPKTRQITGRIRKSGRSTLAEMADGLRYLRREISIMLIIVFCIVHVISGLPFFQLLSVFTETILKVGATGLGILTSVSGIGALIGTLIFASMPNRKRGLLMIFSGVIMGVAVLIFAWSKSWYLSLFMMAIIGIATIMHMTMTVSLIQHYAERNYRARVQSFVTMSAGLAGFGTFIAGTLSELVGVQWAVGGLAIFLTVMSLIYILFIRRVVNME
jgi:MFS family permease